ncbi:MAG: hypothetical protein KKC68_07795, partial [Candidatus Thermoplasmatota archaeon]|nr:hypothetical protein [Candidatus Thermoplasmatota archaeon]MBU1941660.1 hypothetical protein [Candidatus Thermoplasmatota archaeon]
MNHKSIFSKFSIGPGVTSFGTIVYTTQINTEDPVIDNIVSSGDVLFSLGNTVVPGDYGSGQIYIPAIGGAADWYFYIVKGSNAGTLGDYIEFDIYDLTGDFDVTVSGDTLVETTTYTSDWVLIYGTIDNPVGVDADTELTLNFDWTLDTAYEPAAGDELSFTIYIIAIQP